MGAAIETHLDHRLVVLGRRETALPLPVCPGEGEEITGTGDTLAIGKEEDIRGHIGDVFLISRNEAFDPRLTRGDDQDAEVAHAEALAIEIVA